MKSRIFISLCFPSISRFKTEEEVIALANGTSAGLAGRSYLYSSIYRVSINTGMLENSLCNVDITKEHIDTIIILESDKWMTRV